VPEPYCFHFRKHTTGLGLSIECYKRRKYPALNNATPGRCNQQFSSEIPKVLPIPALENAFVNPSSKPLEVRLVA